MTWSEEIPLSPMRFHEILISFNSQTMQIVLYLDSAEVLRIDGYQRGAGSVSYGVNLINAPNIGGEIPTLWFSSPSGQSLCRGLVIAKENYCANSNLLLGSNSDVRLVTIALEYDRSTNDHKGYQPLISIGKSGRGDLVAFRTDTESIWLLHDHWHLAPSVSRHRIGGTTHNNLNIVLAMSSKKFEIYINGFLALETSNGIYMPSAVVKIGNQIDSSLSSAMSSLPIRIVRDESC